MPSTIFSADPNLSFAHLCNHRRKPQKSNSLHRIGPAPKDTVLRATDETDSPNIGTLDSDTENSEDAAAKFNSKDYLTFSDSDKDLRAAAGSRALIIYFAKLAKNRGHPKENIDFHFLETILSGNTDINTTDRHGQTVLHEIARNWHPDAGLFFLQRGAAINSADNWGRTPLHLAAAVNYSEMVDFLIHSGGMDHNFVCMFHFKT